MVEKRNCAFCGGDIEPGTGKLYIRRDGTKLWFDAMKCQKNLLKMKRVNREVKWTRAYVKGQGKVGPAAGGPGSKAPGAAHMTPEQAAKAEAAKTAKRPKAAKAAKTA